MAGIVLSDLRDGITLLTFDQPGSRANVLTTQMWHDLRAALAEAKTRPGLRGLVLASAKPGIFVAGADLKLLADAAAPHDPAVVAFLQLGSDVLTELEAFPVPTCAAVDGAALGGGFEVALACSRIVCGIHPRLELALPEVKLGLIPGWGGTQRLPRRIGIPEALTALHTGLGVPPERFDGVVPSETLIDAACEGVLLAVRTPPAPRDAVTPMTGELYARVCEQVRGTEGESVAARLAATEAVYRGCPLPLAEGLAVERDLFHTLAGGEESRRRIAAFFAARKK